MIVIRHQTESMYFRNIQRKIFKEFSQEEIVVFTLKENWFFVISTIVNMVELI